MVRLTAFTRHKLDTSERAREFLEFLSEDDSPLKPAKYGVSEEVKHVFDRMNLDDPVQLLSGEPGNSWGGIFLKGAKYKVHASIAWNGSGISDWFIEIDDEFFLKGDGTAQFIQFVARLFSKFPAMFCGIAPEEDWKEKHWLVERTDYGEVHNKRGLEISHCLPGIYWVTLMGRALVQRFGKSNLQQLPIHQVVDLDDQGSLLVLREGPFSASLNKRQEQEKQIVSLIGDQFFFDIHNLGKTCEEIEGITASQFSSETSDDSESEEKEHNRISRLEQQIVLSPDGTPFVDPDDLAEAIVVYFHSDLNEVFGYSLSALRALDAHFSQHPPRYEFKQEFLDADLIPALGAYLGKVLARELGGRWLMRDPIMKSTVIKERNERNPFRDAYSVIMEGKHLVEAYNAFQDS